MSGRALKGLTVSFYTTPIGWGAVVAGPGGLREVFLPFEVKSREELERRICIRFPEAGPGFRKDGVSREASLLLERYFNGERVFFEKLPLDLSPFTPFQREVYGVVSRIPYGDFLTYREVAMAVGRPNGARGIGGAMGRNPLPIIIPCHRVVGSSGRMTGYSAPGGIVSKQWLLTLEGVAVTSAGLVVPTGVSSAKHGSPLP